MTHRLGSLSFISIVLAGCSADFQSSEIELNERMLAEKAIVVTSIHAPHSNMVLGETDSAVSSVWQNTANPEIKYRFKSAYWNPGDIQEHMVTPGTYLLKSMVYKINGTEYKLSFSSNTKVTFTANPGEVVYTGDLEVVNAKGGDYGLKVTDNSAAAEKQLQTDIPELRKGLTKRLYIGLN